MDSLVAIQWQHTSALIVLASGVHALTYVGDTSRILSEITAQATPFILACEVGQSVAGALKLPSLPPTNEAFNENVARAHLQVAIWRNALQPDPPAIDPTAYGWSLAEGSKTLNPTTLPSDTPLAPDDLLKLVRCSCSSETPCTTQRCGCSHRYRVNNLFTLYLWLQQCNPCLLSVLCLCLFCQCCFIDRTGQALQTDDDDAN